MTTKEIPFKRWINLSVTITHESKMLDVKLYLSIDESFSSNILLAQKQVPMANNGNATQLTKIMDRGLGRLAEVGMWDQSMNQEDILRL